jgi:nicotinate-nucleotide adenylyltransferase
MTAPARRVGFFGGTFDPVHLGHLILAEQSREQAGLDEVWFVPAGQPPHKVGKPVTRYEQRVEMVELAIAGQPAFRVEQVERDRPGPHYTADTLTELRRDHPGVEFFLLIGADALADLPGWYDPVRVVASATLLVTPRLNYPLKEPDELRAALPPGTPLRVEYVRSLSFVDISGRDLRRRVAEGRSIRYLVPRAVECYVLEKKLYR